MSVPLSAWAIQAVGELPNLAPIAVLKTTEVHVEVRLSEQCLSLVYHWPKQAKTVFRPIFSPVAKLTFKDLQQQEDGVRVRINSVEAFYELNLVIPTAKSIICFTVTMIPKQDLMVPFWPKDLLNFGAAWQLLSTGKIHTHQVGNRSGILFYGLSKPAIGDVLYFQNLGSFNAYFEATETTGADLVGGNWPEIGFSLPPSSAKPLIAGKAYCISDAVVAFTHETAKDDRAICQSYLTQLAAIYPYIKRPEPIYHHWLETVEKGLAGIARHKGCWTFADGHHYLNAYVSDYATPPEIMVQLAVLLPLIEYMAWKGEKGHELIDQLKAGLPSFYKKDMGTVVRWLPALEKLLDHSEEQKKPNVMDSWYLYHPLMNLARLAQKGDTQAKQMLMDSIDYAIKVARTFNYEWPVFYQMETLKVIKAETAEGEGGELDVPGSYADLMLKVWELTKERKYLTEAKRSVKKLAGLGFSTFYQANNTAYGAVALLKLFKETGDKRYLEMSYVNLAGIFNNMQLWEMDYGHGKNFSTFFSIFPLKDAPYTAAYEEQEVYAALSEYLQVAKGLNILPAVKLLIAEFIKYIPSRIHAYYPPLLPEEMLSPEPKTGEIDQELWVAIEDLQDGREPSGQVGQEVYGAGVAFGIVPRQYFMVHPAIYVFVDYPVERYQKKRSSVQFNIGGSELLTCTIVIETTKGDSYGFSAKLKNGDDLVIKSISSQRSELKVKGNQQVVLAWKKQR